MPLNAVFDGRLCPTDDFGGAPLSGSDAVKERSMGDDYSVRLVARNEAVEYRDAFGAYWFDASLDGGEWKVFVPPTVVDGHTQRELTEEEAARVVPRIVEYLGCISWFGLFPRRYRVSVERAPAFSPEETYRMLESEGWERRPSPDGSVLFLPPTMSLGVRVKMAVGVLRAIVGWR